MDMNIVLALSNYLRLTGSEIYVYELARALSERDCTVTILANGIGGVIKKKTQDMNIKMYNFFDHPALTPDVVHCSQPGPTAYCLKVFPNTPHVVTIHSHLIYEEPIIHTRVKHYICVRPEIEEAVLTRYPQLKGKTSVIYNGVDTYRFNNDGDPHKNSVLFVGTNDHLRAQVIRDLEARCKKDGKELVLVGEGFPNPPVWDIERYVKDCSETAGIYMGRTTIEGWMCGKPGWIYDVDENGAIKDIAYTQPPKDLTMFDIDYMVHRILEVYDKS